MSLDPEFEEGKWLPLVEFSVQKGISLSTLRRYIKANKIPWKLMVGRYLIRDDGSFQSPRVDSKSAHAFPQDSVEIPVDYYSLRVKNLQLALHSAHEEIAELKSLVALYEEKWAQISNN